MICMSCSSPRSFCNIVHLVEKRNMQILRVRILPETSDVRIVDKTVTSDEVTIVQVTLQLQQKSSLFLLFRSRSKCISYQPASASVALPPPEPSVLDPIASSAPASALWPLPHASPEPSWGGCCPAPLCEASWTGSWVLRS